MFYEKLTWSSGDGHRLRVAKTEYGHIGNLICGENTNPLARYSLMAQGEQIHISKWPTIWPTRVSMWESPEENNLPKEERNDSGPRNYDNSLANRTHATAHCFEAKCFSAMCAGLLDQRAMNTIIVGSSTPQQVRQALQDSPQGASMFLDPTGTPLPSFIVCEQTKANKPAHGLQTEEGILYADLELTNVLRGSNTMMLSVDINGWICSRCMSIAPGRTRSILAMMRLCESSTKYIRSIRGVIIRG